MLKAVSMRAVIQPVLENAEDVGGGASAAEIAQAQQDLKVRFPPSYGRFLAELGWLDTPLLSIYGLVALPRHVEIEHHLVEPHMPAQLLPVAPDGAGNHWCLDLSHPSPDGECPVVFWDHEAEDGPDQVPQVVAPSFGAWLVQHVQDLTTPLAA